MNTDETIVQEAAKDGKDRRTRRLLIFLSVLVVLSFLTTLGAGWYAWEQKQQQVNAGANLAAYISKSANACPEGSDLGVRTFSFTAGNPYKPANTVAFTVVVP